MSEALKAHITNSLSILEGTEFEAPSDKKLFIDWVRDQIKEKKPVMISILKSAIRKGII